MTKHKPQFWNDLVFADVNTEADLYPFVTGARADHILLHGPFGTGKSTTAAIIAGKGKVHKWTQKISVASPDLNDTIVNFHYKSASAIGLFNSGNPIGIVEEIDQLTIHQQFLFRQVMDDCDAARFIFTTNHLASVDPGIRSRATPFLMELPIPKQWLPRAHAILNSEGVAATDAEILHQIGQYKGDMRSTIRALEDMVKILATSPISPQNGLSSTVAPLPAGTSVTKRIRNKKLVRPAATVGQLLGKTP